MTAPPATSPRRSPREPEAVDQRRERGGQHLLVADVGVGAHAARERNAGAAEDRDAADVLADEHGSLREVAGAAAGGKLS